MENVFGGISYRPAIPHASRVRLQQLPSPMSDKGLRLLPFLQNTLALINCNNFEYVVIE